MLEKAAIAFKEVTRYFGSTRALNRFSLSVADGDFVLMLGANGSGKSTAINCATGMLRPDSGEVHLFGEPVYRHGFARGGASSTRGSLLQHVGLVTSEPMLYQQLTIVENLLLLATVGGVHKEKRRVEQLIELLELNDFADKQLRHCSSGIVRRASIARALLLNPRLLVLDEPLTNLDSAMRAKLILLLRELNQEGKTLLVVTHEPEQFAECEARSVTLRQGAIVAEECGR